MEKTIFEEKDGTYHEGNGYLISNLTLTSEEEKPIGDIGTATFTVSQTEPQIGLYQFADKRIAEQPSCRC